MAKSAKRPSPAEWAKANPARAQGPPCWLCMHREAAKAIEEFRALTTPPTIRVIAEYLRKFYDFPFSAFSVGRHIREHGDRK